MSTIVGVAVTKLFLLSSRFDDIHWIGAALACALATTVMALTKTVHPPAGATALLAVVDPNLREIGWFLIPVMLLGCTLMLGVALVVNNIERRFPMYWWIPEDLKQTEPIFLRRKSSQQTSVSEEEATNAREREEDDASHGNCMVQDDDSPDLEANQVVMRTGAHEHVGEVVIKHGQVIVPEHMFITQEEELLLESMSYRI